MGGETEKSRTSGPAAAVAAPSTFASFFRAGILSIVADLDTLGEILASIIPKLDDFAQHTGQNGRSESEMRLLMHQSHAGCVIGRAGCRIKELREVGSSVLTGANNQGGTGSCCPGSTERIVKVTGSPSVVVDCIKQICDIIAEAPVKGLNKPYDPHNFDPEFAQEYGGFAEGPTSTTGVTGVTPTPGPRGGGGVGAVPFWRDEPVEPFGRGPKRGGPAGGGSPWGAPSAAPQAALPLQRGGAYGEEARAPWGGGGTAQPRDFQRPFRGTGARGGYSGRGSYNEVVHQIWGVTCAGRSQQAGISFPHRPPGPSRLED
ncbi:transformation upregulated nuclear protein, putative [Ixodes scapularis]|uniref:Transformation upregulated nuclear protein, putative n=1 Tax=Ixodes scapularis TaxID=6945 RepID=B7P3N6_IXOSC|nr:transformation upregulated nuclear protein, putative [Ixodes scapularis]|eukprot:XP_002404460.1 transformation upregulated nuclear protein, putative [Ixodes scapularis]